MHGFDRFEQDDGGIVFRDLLTLALCGFLVCVVLMLPHLNPAAARSQDGGIPPGNVVVEVNWPPEIDADVDLWVQGPGDVPVGYSNKGGALFNLLRDDLGHQLDVSGQNYEVSYSRGIMAGAYTVNVHLYRNRSSAARIPVTIVVSTKRDTAAPTRQILVTDLDLTQEGDEITVFRFDLNEQGGLVANSVNNLQKPLRSGTKSS